MTEKVMYRTSYDTIDAREVAKETAAFVSFETRTGRIVREAKRSDYQNWFDTWQEAKEFLISKAQRRVEACQDELQRATKELEHRKGMQQKPSIKEQHP